MPNKAKMVKRAFCEFLTKKLKKKSIKMPLKVKVVEREQQIAIQQQEIQRKEKELNSKVRVCLIFLWLKCNSESSLYSAFKVRAPAEAEKYRLEKIFKVFYQVTFSRSGLQLRRKNTAWKRLPRQRRAGRCSKQRPR